MEAELQARIAAFKDARILCLGDVMLDRFIYGQVSRISPEAPIPVLSSAARQAMLGGAGNVARNIEALGAHCILAAVVGDDEAGAQIQAQCAAAAGITPRLALEAGRPTTVKSRYVAGGQQLIRVDDETASAVTDASADALLQAAEAALGEVQAVVLSDYGKGALGVTFLRQVIERARDAGVAVIVDPKGRDFSRYGGATLIKPNRVELELETGLKCGSDEEVVAAAEAVLAQSGVERLLVSRSDKGVSLIEADGEPYHLAARAHQVFDVSGAGDTVTATIAAVIAAGGNYRSAALLANLAGGIVIAKAGTAVVTAGELARAVNDAAPALPASKVMAADQIADRVARWRAAGLRVGFTNGCFDLLHPGHIALLSEARQHCERLIVAINSDASVQRLKGPGRPLQTAAARAEILAALAAVDAVCVFEDDTPLVLLEALQPDLLIKGGDYGLDEVVGGDLVTGYGGEVRVTRHVQGAGTSDLIAKERGGA